MKTTITIFFLMTSIFLGCSHKHTVRTDSASLVPLQQKVKNKKVKVTLKDSQFYSNVRLMRLTPDSTSWMRQNGEVMSIPTGEISEIRFLNRGTGALEGLGIGFLAGAPTGAIIGFASGDASDGIFPMTAEEKAVLGGIFVGSIGGLVGLTIGAVVGSKNIYNTELESPHSTTTIRK